MERYQRFGGISIHVYVPSLLIPAAFPFTRTGPLGIVTVSRKDIGDMSPVTVSLLRDLRARAGGRVR